MRGIHHITVAVDDNLYRQTRRLAADHDTTVTDMVRFLLLAMPSALEEAGYRGGRPRFLLAAERAAEAGAPWPPPVGAYLKPAVSDPDEPYPEQPGATETAIPPDQLQPADQRAPRQPRRSKYDLSRYEPSPRF